MASHDDYKKAMEHRLKNAQGFTVPDRGECKHDILSEKKPISRFEMFCVAVICACLIGLFLLIYSPADASAITKAEKLTQDEITQINAARAKSHKAMKEEEELRDKIAKSHDMKNVDWMEWSAYYEINGEYIILYHQSHMPEQ